VPGPSVSYSDCDPGVLHGCIAAVTDAGDAVTFGRTSEGGAYYVGILSDGLLEKFYLGTCESLQEALRGMECTARG
jgi:hypothetical protein